MAEKKRFIMVHESYAASLANDLTTFALLAGMFWANQEYLNSAIPDLVLTILFLVFAFLKFSFAKRAQFTNRDSAVEAIDVFFKTSSERKAQDHGG